MGCRINGDELASTTESCEQLTYFKHVIRKTEEFDQESNDGTCRYERSIQELVNGCGCFANPYEAFYYPV